jgi:competence protein ComEA
MQRAIIIMLAVMVLVPLFLKSRMKGIPPPSAAFSVMSSAGAVVKVSGDVRHPGIYRLGANKMTIDAIKMAVPVCSVQKISPAQTADNFVRTGLVLDLLISADGIGVIRATKMSSAERIVLGIPLDINDMSAADFDRLPGVGPALAERIITYRQKNGGKMTVEELREVAGIGEGKYSALGKYF